MKKITMLLITLLLLSACSDSNGVSELAENPAEIIGPELTKEPEDGDIFVVQKEGGEQTIHAYLERNSEIKVEDRGSKVLDIYLEEPGKNEDFILHTLELENKIEGGTLNFYLNGEKTSAEVIIE